MRIKSQPCDAPGRVDLAKSYQIDKFQPMKGLIAEATTVSIYTIATNTTTSWLYRVGYYAHMVGWVRLLRIY
jgi:hypothetical protein